MVEKKRHFWQRTEVEESGMSVEKWVLPWGIGRLFRVVEKLEEP